MIRFKKIKDALKIFWTPIKKKDKCLICGKTIGRCDHFFINHPELKKVVTGMKVEDILKSINENYKNEDVIQVKNIFVFENGNVAVCDNNGKQIPFLQGILSNSNFEIKN